MPAGPSRDQHLARVYRDALAAGLGEEGARVAVAIAVTEHGYEGGVGDLDRSALGSAGTFQAYFGGGQGDNFAAQHRMTKQQARDYLKQNPHAANRWALEGYLGNAIRQGQQQGLRGADLATYAQRVGQRSEDPGRSGRNYQAVWSTNQPAITQGAAQDQGARYQTVADTGGGTVEGDRPASEFEPPSRFPPPAPAAPPTSPKLEAIRKQLDVLNRRLTDAQKALAGAQGLAPEGEMTSDERRTFDAHKATAITQARADAKAAQDDVDRLELQQGEEEKTLAAAAAKAPAAPPRVTRPDGSVVERQPDGTYLEVLPPQTRPSTSAAATPHASRTYKSGGVTYTETEPDAGGFSPLPSGIDDPNAMTAYQAASLPISQQNADTSRISATAAQLHAQVAKGTLDYTTAKTVFDYVVAQQAPVEEGGALYRPGRQPSSSSRQTLGLSVQPYSVVDAAGFYGRPELNQYVRGGYPFGAGPMSPAEYQQRQAGTFQGAPARPAPPAGTALDPSLLAPAPPVDPGRLDQRHGEQGAGAPAGGFQPQPQAAMATAGAGVPTMPAFGGATGGGATGGGADVLQQQQALMAETDKIRQHLLTLGVRPEVADQAARQYLGVGPTMAQTPF